MAEHIGIVACSAEGAALCYRTIAREGAEQMGRHQHPEVTMHTHPLAAYMDCVQRGDWDGVAELMVDSAQRLATAGASFAICPDNTIHQVYDAVAEQSPLPWLHIAREVAAEAQRRGFGRLAITGTKYLMEGPVYPAILEEYGLDHAIPAAAEREEINRIIFEELVYGSVRDESLATFQRVVKRMKDEDRCDAVVLGCTEIPLILSEDNCPLPPLDSTRLLARAALRRAVHGTQLNIPVGPGHHRPPHDVG